MSVPRDYTEYEELILKQIDGDLDEHQFAQLCDYLRESPEHLDHYLEFISLCAGMLKPGEVIIPDYCLCDEDDFIQSKLWVALAENERTAEAVSYEETENLPVPVYRDKVTRPVHHISKATLYVGLSLTAALLLMIMYVVTHPRVMRNPVATLTGSSDAVWIQDDGLNGENKRLYTNSTYHLLEGFAEITFDNQAKLVLQSPAEFYVEDYNQILLHSGKLSALIPKTAWGFVVRTQGASVVDYGTEFGVTADSSGQTEVHVFNGKVELRSGFDPIRFESKKSLVAGQAGRVDEAGQLMSEEMKAIPSSYMRQLPKKAAFGHPGKCLDLSDIVGNGNGFGTGQSCVGIDPTTGLSSTELLINTRTANRNEYFLVKDNTFIDGVFIPSGEEIPQIVSSEGHVFDECPKTGRSYWIDISNKPYTTEKGNASGEPDDLKLARMNGIQYGSVMHPAIAMHANVGITFDLDAIRATIPGTRIRSFTSICGLSDTLIGTGLWDGAEADMWVLLDGQKRKVVHFASKGQMQADLKINISDSDRFLTLISTDATQGNAGDWTLYGEPALELERAEWYPQ